MTPYVDPYMEKAHAAAGDQFCNVHLRPKFLSSFVPRHPNF